MRKSRAAGIIIGMTMAFTAVAPVMPIGTYVSAAQMQVIPVNSAGDMPRELDDNTIYILKNDIENIKNPITINNTTVIDLNGHTLAFNISSSSSSSRAIYNYGTLTITDTSTSGNGKITNSGSGGCLSNDNGAVLTIAGGSITGNNSKSNGGGIYNDGTLNITGGSITENTAANYGGGIYNNGTISISGKVDIMGNKKGSSEDDIYLANKSKISVTGDLTGSQIGVKIAGNTSNTNSVFTSNYTKYNPALSPADVFFADEESYAVTLIDGEAALISAGDKKYKVQYKWKKQDDDKYTCTVTVNDGSDETYTREYPDLDGSLNEAYENDSSLILSSRVPAASSGLEARIRNGELTMKVTYKAAEGYIIGIGFNVNGTKDVEKNGFKAYSATYYVKVGAEGGVTIKPYYINSNGERVNGESTTIAG